MNSGNSMVMLFLKGRSSPIVVRDPRTDGGCAGYITHLFSRICVLSAGVQRWGGGKGITDNYKGTWRMDGNKRDR
jgi:hypothetical protein